MSTMANMMQLHQHQKNLIQQQSKYNNSIAEYNMNKVIKYYKDAINSAETSNEARGLAQSLEGLLTQYGKGLGDVDGLNTNLINGNQNIAGNAAGKAGGQKGSEYDKQIIADLSGEFGIDVKKSGTKKDWGLKAKSDPNVKVLDKNGNDITAERNGQLKTGDILAVNSKKHGLVKISVGGDGEINGKDDKVLSVGGKVAANNINNGLNQINNVGQNQQNNTQANAATGNIFANGIIDPQQAALAKEGDLANMQTLFNDAQIKNLIAAILNQSLYQVEQKEYMKAFQ